MIFTCRGTAAVDCVCKPPYLQCHRLLLYTVTTCDLGWSRTRRHALLFARDTTASDFFFSKSVPRLIEFVLNMSTWLMIVAFICELQPILVLVRSCSVKFRVPVAVPRFWSALRPTLSWWVVVTTEKNRIMITVIIEENLPVVSLLWCTCESDVQYLHNQL